MARSRLGTSSNGFGPGSTPNFLGPSVNALAIVLEVPSVVLTRAGSSVIGVWARTEIDGVQVDRMGRPAINTVLIPPIPRASSFPIGGAGQQNRQERRSVFHIGHPKNDRVQFLADMVSVLTAFSPAGGPGGVPDSLQATVLAELLLPDILVFDVTSSAGFLGNRSSVGGPNLPALVTQNVGDASYRPTSDSSPNTRRAAAGICVPGPKIAFTPTDSSIV